MVRRRWRSGEPRAGGLRVTTGPFLSDHLPNVMIHNGLFIPFYSLIILGLSQRHWLSNLLSASWLVLLGEASYALYLFHFLFNDWTKDSFGAGNGIASALWKVAILIPVSIALHLSIERPGRRLILQWWSRRQSAKSDSTPLLD